MFVASYLNNAISCLVAQTLDCNSISPLSTEVWYHQNNAQMHVKHVQHLCTYIRYISGLRVNTCSQISLLLSLSISLSRDSERPVGPELSALSPVTSVPDAEKLAEATDVSALRVYGR